MERYIVIKDPARAAYRYSDRVSDFYRVLDTQDAVVVAAYRGSDEAAEDAKRRNKEASSSLPFHVSVDRQHTAVRLDGPETIFLVNPGETITIKVGA